MTNIPRKQPDYTVYWEALADGVYPDSKGYLTIGYGHRVSSFMVTAALREDILIRELDGRNKGLVPEPLAKMILQYDLGQAVLRLMDILGPEVWRSLDDEQKHRLLPANAVDRHKYGFRLHQEISLASPRQVVLMDWCLNTGGGSMPGFVEAVKGQNWRRAALELQFINPQGDRTNYYNMGGHTAYYLTRPERADLNADVILAGKWPEPNNAQDKPEA